MPTLRLALAQTNPRLGDFLGNSDKIASDARLAFDQGADIVVFGEMAISGYPIEDLATRPEFLHRARTALDSLAARLAADGVGHIPVLVGFPHGPADHASASINAPASASTAHSPTAIAYNSAAVLHDGRVIGIYSKHHLPNYSVFDEYRNFRVGTQGLILHLAGADVAVAICEDIWREGGPVAALSQVHPGLLLVINGSPFEREKDEVRLPLVQRRALELNAPVAYLNLVGGQDDLVFDGDSFVVNAGGKLIARSPQFIEDLMLVDMAVAESRTHGRQIGYDIVVVDAGVGNPHRAQRLPHAAPIATPGSALEQIWNALVLGLKDYVGKNGFPSVILGLSGGIDSAVCAAIAVDALGPGRVFGVSMPSNYSSEPLAQ
jgi:NAD+ synthase (glutamine-hydrolysing)